MNIIIITGIAGAGKSTLGRNLCRDDKKLQLIVIDDYLKFGIKEMIPLLISDIKAADKTVVLEGFFGWRLLRHLSTPELLKELRVMLVIELVISETNQKVVYDTERSDVNFVRILAQNKANQSHKARCVDIDVPKFCVCVHKEYMETTTPQNTPYFVTIQDLIYNLHFFYN